jgi:hypothetical protein
MNGRSIWAPKLFTPLCTAYTIDELLALPGHCGCFGHNVSSASCFHKHEKVVWYETERQRKARSMTTYAKHKPTMKALKGKGTKLTQKGLHLKPETPKPIHPFLRARKLVTAVPEPVEDDEEMTDNEEDEDRSNGGGRARN